MNDNGTERQLSMYERLLELIAKERDAESERVNDDNENREEDERE